MVVLLILASIAISFAVNFIFDTFLLNYVRRDIIPKKDIFAIEAIYVSQLINFCFFFFHKRHAMNKIPPPQTHTIPPNLRNGLICCLFWPALTISLVHVHQHTLMRWNTCASSSAPLACPLSSCFYRSITTPCSGCLGIIFDTGSCHLKNRQVFHMKKINRSPWYTEWFF